MHHKKRKLFVLYSIPIWFRKRFNSFSKSNLCNKEKLYLVSYSIPLSCMVVLLLGLGLMVGVDIFLSSPSNAIEAGDNMSNDEGVMPLAAPTPVIAIDVSSATNDGYGNDVAGQVETAPGAGTAYRSHKVKITGSNIMSYNLSISGPAELTGSSGVSTKVSGANGKTGAEMSSSNSNIWGYAWGQDSDAVEEMTYNTMSTSGTGLVCDDPSSTYSVNCERKLVFGANFGANADSGTYTSQVQLSLTATPAVVTYTLSYNANGGSNAPAAQTADSSDASYQFTIKEKGSMAKTGYNFLGWSTSSSATTADTNYAPGTTVTLQKDNPTKTLYAVWKAITLDAITTMQEMTPAICQNAADGATKTLKDSRDNKSYTVIKHSKDHKCWMQQNLQLNLTSGATTEGSKSDGSTYSWTVPTNANNKNMSATTQAYSTSGTWTSDNTVVMSRAGNGNNGNYYTWCAATAGTCAQATTANAVASASICPKGWHLPTGGGSGDTGTGEFGTLLNGVGSPAVTQSPYGFPYAGYVDRNGSLYVGSYGGYWSSTALSGTFAYCLYFDSSGSFGPGAGISDRYSGSSVRCVANS